LNAAIEGVVMPDLPGLAILFQRFAIALGLGLMIGVEREREKGEGSFAGIRTFSLITLMGCAAAMLNDLFAPWSFVITFVILACLVVASYALTASAGAPGLTTEVASLLGFLYGALVWWQMVELAAALAVVTVLLLATKKPLEQLSQRIGPQDITAALQFGIITLIVLPILPDRTYGPLEVLNPRGIWRMVVLIAAINLVGYASIKILGSDQGIGLAGLLGGLVSSTAVALGFSRRSRTEEALSPALALGVLLASTVMFPRVLLEAFTVNPALARILLAPIASAGGVGLLCCGYVWFAQFYRGRSRPPEGSQKEHVEASNPFELWPAIQFGLLFGFILLISKAAQEYAGTAGVYLSSAVAGLTDVDAITLSLSNLAGDAISNRVAARGITLAALANTSVKAAIAATAGSSGLRRLTLPIFGAMILAGMVVSFLLI
jgi:uncharacterized membrane protein (DUF4010 family)